MKRATLPKRRQRKVGLATYSGKVSHVYSGAYQSWRAQFRKKEVYGK